MDEMEHHNAVEMHEMRKLDCGRHHAILNSVAVVNTPRWHRPSPCGATSVEATYEICPD